MFVVYEIVFFVVPVQDPVEFVSDDGELAYRCTGGSVLEVLERTEPVLHAVKKVTGDVACPAAVCADFNRFERFDRVVAMAKFPFGSDEGDIVSVRVVRFYSVGEYESHLIFVFVFIFSGRDDLYGEIGVHSESVEGAAEFVCTPISEETVTVIGVLSPTAAVTSGGAIAAVWCKRGLA